LKKYTLEEIKNNPELMEHSDHCDYVGDGKYVVDLSMPSYVNHSCDPNTYIEFKNLKQKNSDMYAIKDIKKGDEITYDCSLNAIDQIKVE
jgi:SET domain-containing protein